MNPILSIAVPPEPSVGSGGHDRFGRVWQRLRDPEGLGMLPAWYPAAPPTRHGAYGGGGVTWPMLLAERGPFTLTHDAGEGGHDPAQAERDAASAAAREVLAEATAQKPARVPTADECIAASARLGYSPAGSAQ